MTKKHFRALATALAASRPNSSAVTRQQWELDVQQVIRVCADFNPAFDQERFALWANGIEEN